MKHFKVGDMVRVVGLTAAENLQFNGHEGGITGIMTCQEEFDAVYPELRGQFACDDPYGSIYVVDGCAGAAIQVEDNKPRFGLGFMARNLRLIHPPATKSFGAIIQALRKGTKIYG